MNYLGSLTHFEGDNRAAESTLREALAVMRDGGDRRGYATCLYYLGRVAFDRDDLGTDRGLWTESVAICQAERYLWLLPYRLEGFGSIAVAEGHLQRAVRLAAAAAPLHEAIGAPLPPVWRADFRQRLEPVRSVLDDGVYASAWAEGRSMTLDQALAYALVIELP